MSDTMPERRLAPRFPIILAAEVTELPSNTRLVARTSDVSRVGCYIDTLNPSPVGTPVHVRLTQEGITFECDARVVYISPGLGMGVAFDKASAEKQAGVLDSWLNKAAGDETS